MDEVQKMYITVGTLKWIEFSIPFVLLIIGFVVTMIKFRASAKEKEKAVNLVAYDLSKRVTTLENKNVITVPEHDKRQEHCRSEIFRRLENQSEEIAEIKETVKRSDQCVKEAKEEMTDQLAAMRVDHARFHKEIRDTLAPIAKTLAMHEVKIQHLEDARR